MSKIDSNFEHLKKRVTEQKKIAEKTENDMDENINNNTNTDTIVDKELCVNNSANINNDVDVNKNVNTNNDINVDKNINKITIKKARKQEKLKRVTFYLKPSMIEKINKYSKISGMGKSEFIQTLLSKAFDLLEIQESE